MLTVYRLIFMWITYLTDLLYLIICNIQYEYANRKHSFKLYSQVLYPNWKWEVFCAWTISNQTSKQIHRRPPERGGLFSGSIRACKKSRFLSDRKWFWSDSSLQGGGNWSVKVIVAHKIPAGGMAFVIHHQRSRARVERVTTALAQVLVRVTTVAQAGDVETVTAVEELHSSDGVVHGFV